MKKVLVLGCGVSGLSTGIELLARGYEVAIWAKELPPHTTSDTAAAVWAPYLCSPREKAIPWARETFRRFEEIILDPQSGCSMKEFSQYFDVPREDPWWEEAYPFPIERLAKSELPDGYQDGYRFKTIVIDTSHYMPYLLERFIASGGVIEQKEVMSMGEALANNPLLVNCTGLGSRALCSDEELYPVRGQVLKIKKGDWNVSAVDDDGPNQLALIVARTDDMILGGTAQVNDWDTNPRTEDTATILAHVHAIAPQLSLDLEFSVSVGLRPARSAIRLEREDFPRGTVIHNYGHGGSGFTLSWGCAQEAADLVESV